MGLTNHTRPILHHWLLMPLGADTQTDRQIHTHTDVQTKTISRNQVRGLTWFKNLTLSVAMETTECSAALDTLPNYIASYVTTL